MLLDRLCPEVRKVAKLIEEKVIQPLRKGQDVVIDRDSSWRPTAKEILEKM
jgi:hypothetical protein